MAAPTTIDLDTELSAVNSVLGAIGQSPVTRLNYDNPEQSFIYNLIKECNMDIQQEGWTFNKEYHVQITPAASVASNKTGYGYITYPPDVLQYALHGGLEKKSQRLVRRKGRVYDTVDHTDEFKVGDEISVDRILLFKFEDLPHVFRRYVIYCASTRAAIQLVGNPQLVQLLQTKEVTSRAACLEYECNQTDPTFFGATDDQNYIPFIPLDALRR